MLFGIAAAAVLLLLLFSTRTSLAAWSLLVTRRNVLESSSAAAAATLLTSSSSSIQPPPPADAAANDGITELVEQAPRLKLRANNGVPTILMIPSIGYSYYKTDEKYVGQCTELALAAGVRHFDCATSYSNTNAAVGDSLRQYLKTGLVGIPQATTALSARDRRQELFVTHKLSNAEQSTNRNQVKRHVKNEMKKLAVDYLDLCMIHSPLTDQERRLSTYAALSELQAAGIVKSIGVCHYGVQPLDEIVKAGLPAPAVIQLQLSPFNRHQDVVDWAATHDSVLSCAAWSKLSSTDGPVEGWAVVADLAKAKGVTKAQVLVRWALQMGYVCVPRSSAASKIERQAIAENSYNGVKALRLSEAEMDRLNKLDIGLPAGQLGVTDGYTISDIPSREWDPTTAKV